MIPLSSTHTISSTPPTADRRWQEIENHLTKVLNKRIFNLFEAYRYASTKIIKYIKNNSFDVDKVIKKEKKKKSFPKKIYPKETWNDACWEILSATFKIKYN